jgi:hypothetical protein
MMNTLIPLVTVAACAALTLTSQATILSGVPMQGGMVMPMVSYSSATDSLQVMPPTEIPQLTPLLVSHVGDSFDPADPWFDALDPSRQGASFSRRYGFVMNPNSDLLPLNREMWIRLVSASPELRVYRNANNPPKAWDPIFGTDGSPLARAWNGLMFHPAFTAAPGPDPLNATFELYLTDPATGVEIPESATGPLVFNFSNVPDGRPALELGPQMVVCWPANTASNWTLETAASPEAATWTPVTRPPVIVDGQQQITLEGAAPQQYFRMRYIP